MFYSCCENSIQLPLEPMSSTIRCESESMPFTTSLTKRRKNRLHSIAMLVFTSTNRFCLGDALETSINEVPFPKKCNRNGRSGVGSTTSDGLPLLATIAFSQWFFRFLLLLRTLIVGQSDKCFITIAHTR